MFWGIVAILFASFGAMYENLIQFVNIVGSIFYGTILGIFLVAFYFKRITANSVFIAGVISQILIFLIFYKDIVSYLWLNIIGALLVIVISHVVEVAMPKGGTNKEIAQ